MQWSCVFAFCVFSAVSLRILMSHLNQVHSDDNFKIVCGLSDAPACQKVFTKYNSFYKHMRRKHDDVFRGRASPPQHRNYFIVPIDEETDSESQIAFSSYTEGDDQEVEDQTATDAIQDLENEAKEHAILILESMREMYKLPQMAINHFMQGMTKLCQDSVKIAEEKVRRRLVDILPEDCDLGDCFDVTEESLFQDCGSDWLRNQFFKKHFHVVEPVQKTLGTTLSSQGGGRTRRRLFKTHSFCFIPFIQNVVALLSNDSLRKTMLEAKCKNANGKFEYIQDGAVLSNHPLFSRSRTATLEIILYSDEIELCNAVGTRVKKHKLLMFYYIIGNLPKMYRSVLSAINLYAVVRTEDVATYGFDTILQPLLEDMHKLSRAGGYPIELKGGELIHINAGLVAYIADNPAAHQAIGLKESVGGAFRKCRFCHADYDAMQKGFCEEDFDPRNLEQHLQQCDVIRNATQALKDHFRTAYGINRKSILCDFPHFDIFKQTPPDVMHVLLEGVIPLTLQALIKHFINSKQTTLVEINNGIENFLYGYMENKDKPNLIRQQDLQSSSTCLNQDAAKCHLLFQIFPFIAGKNIDPNDDHWTLYTLLAEITDISFAPVISLETIAKLKEAVRGYLTLFKELFPEQPFTPKQHYLVHLPKVILLLGPLINLWAMRFEAKHQYFKQLKKILNFKNLSLSLCRHHQKLAAISRNSMLKENVYGPVRQLQGEELSRTKQRISSTLSIQENSINILESFKWIIYSWH